MTWYEYSRDILRGTIEEKGKELTEEEQEMVESILRLMEVAFDRGFEAGAQHKTAQSAATEQSGTQEIIQY